MKGLCKNMAILKIRTSAMSAGLAPNDWVEVGGRLVYAGTWCKVTGIEAKENGAYTVHMVETYPVTYDSLGKVRPLFAVNAIDPEGQVFHSVTVTDVVAVEEVEEAAAEEVEG